MTTTVLHRDVPYVPTDEQVVRAMLKFANVSPADTVYDLGCGDGRIVLGAARLFSARAVGVDIDPQRMRECHENLFHLRPEQRDRVTFRQESFFDIDLRPATVVVLYLLPKINVQLRPKLLRELPTGARIIANTFRIGDWEPDESAELHRRMIHLWIIPAFLEGHWKLTLAPPLAPSPNAPAAPRHFHLALTRRYQHLAGTASTGTSSSRRRELPLGAGRIRGPHVSFRIPDPDYRGGLLFTGTLQGPYLRGTATLNDNPATTTPWFAQRTR